MGKSRKKKYRELNDLKELDAIRTQEGIQAAEDQSAPAPDPEPAPPAEEAEEQTPQPPEQQAAQPANPHKAELHWSEEDDPKFSGDVNIVLTRMCNKGCSQTEIQQFADTLYALPTKEDAVKMLQMKHLELDQLNATVANNNNNPKQEESTMADNNTNANTTPNAQNNNADLAQVLAQLQQQNAVVTKPASGMTTTEKVVLYTAAGVAVLGVVIGIIAIAKARSAHSRIDDIGSGAGL